MTLESEHCWWRNSKVRLQVCVEVFQFAAMPIIVPVVTILAATVPAAVVAGTLPVSLSLAAIYLERSEFLFVALAILGVFPMLAGRLYSSTLTMLENSSSPRSRPRS